MWPLTCVSYFGCICRELIVRVSSGRKRSLTYVCLQTELFLCLLVLSVSRHVWSVVGFFLLHIVTICVESFSLNILTIRKICFVAPGSKAVREITLSLSETLLHCFAVSLVSKTMCPTNVSIVHLVVTQLCAASFSTLY